MARTEFYDDPAAPKATGIVVACTVFVLDEQDRVLLICRTDNGLWAIPGGAQHVGESITETAVRQTWEESGIDVQITGLVGLYSDPRHVMADAGGEVRQQVSICLRGLYLGGDPTPGSDASHVRWVLREELDDLLIHPSMRLRIDHGYGNLPAPYIG